MKARLISFLVIAVRIAKLFSNSKKSLKGYLPVNLTVFNRVLQARFRQVKTGAKGFVMN
jgi:hypothetical protein